jgi:membrane protein DedA with SNARE-associated domain
VVAAVVAALAVWKREHLSGERKLTAAVLVIALVVYGSGLLGLLPDPKKAIEDLAKALGPWTYALVGTLAFLETGAFVGLIAPGEFAVIVGGVVAGQGEIDLIPLLGLVWFCCIAGDSVSFFVGRRLGRSFLERHGPRVKITHERLEMVEGYFDRHGGKTVLIGRFIGLVRAIAPFIAGASGMRYGRFIPYSVIGTGLWATTYTLLGYFFWQSFDRVAAIAGRATLVFTVLIAIGVGVVYAYRRLRDEEDRRRFAAWVERQARRPLLRPVAAVVRPVWRGVLRPVGRVIGPRARFLWHRLTPGDLGIELTTALAVAAVGSYVFLGYAITFANDPDPTLADRKMREFVENTRIDMGVDIAKFVTHLGDTNVVLAVTLVALVALALKRRPIEMGVLFFGTILTFWLSTFTKGEVMRPRPAGDIIEVGGYAYPSGHAAHAVVYTVLAVIAARVFRGAVSRVSLVIAGLIVTAAVGASRVYLDVHWSSDVWGGFGLGAAVFATLGVVGLVIGYVRNNEPAPAAAGGGSHGPE